jgi:two-component system, NarL family, response regulator DevR
MPGMDGASPPRRLCAIGYFRPVDSSPVTRVVLHDGDSAVRNRLRQLLDGISDIEVVGEADSLPAAARQIRRHAANVVIVDVHQTEDGLALCRKAMARFPRVKCVVLSAFDPEGALLDALLVGAKAYVSEDPARDELEAAVRAATSDEWPLQSGIASRAIQQPDEVETLLSSLSAQEQQIVRLMAEGYTNREIASRLRLAEKTVRNYVSNLLRKLKARNRTQVVGMLARLATEPAGTAPVDPSQPPATEIRPSET